MLTKTDALEVTGKGIRVNENAPGAIAADMNREMSEDEQKKKDKEMRIPMHWIGWPEELAKVALFLASDDASYMTGTTVYVDGGRTLILSIIGHERPWYIRVCLRNNNSHLLLL